MGSKRRALEDSTACVLNEPSSSSPFHTCKRQARHVFPQQQLVCQATAWLTGLLRGVGGAGNVPEKAWLAFAEFHLIMDHSFGTVSAATLAGYHSFTRMARANLWQRFAASYGFDATAHHAMLCGQQPGAPIHLQMVLFMLEHVLAPYPDAALIKYTFRSVPAFLHGWCAKWGICPNTPISFVSVHAFAPAQGGGSTASCSSHVDESSLASMVGGDKTVRALFVPIFPC